MTRSRQAGIPRPGWYDIWPSKMDKTCFVIGPIGDEGSDIRRHADWVLDGIVNPALEKAGLPPGIRADKIATPGMIDSQVISNVLDVDLVIADLTTRNPNAFYELGLRHMAEKPIVHLIHKSEAKLIPFDVAPYRTVYVSWETPADVANSIEKLHEQVQAAISPDHDVENPVTKARGRQHLKATASSTEKVLLEDMQGLSDRVAELERRPMVVTYSPGATPYFNQGFVGQYQHPSVNPPQTYSGLGSLALTAGVVRNLNGKAAVFADTTDGQITVTVEGAKIRLTKDQWEDLPLWNGPFP